MAEPEARSLLPHKLPTGTEADWATTDLDATQNLLQQFDCNVVGVSNRQVFILG